ncbi:MAG: tetratricopeptide repeat protein [Magnetococcales bacterium]|nr:tetratricopeptide repeat protein [Nitrospirota bacterium]
MACDQRIWIILHTHAGRWKVNRTALKIVSVLCIALCWFVVASCQPSVRYVRARGGDDAKAYYHRGNDFAKNKDYDRAIENYSRAIAINPKYAEAHNNRGAAYLDKKDKRQGCTDLQRACELGVCKGYDKTRQSGVCTDGISSQEVAEADRGDSGMRLDRPDRSDDYKDPVAPPPLAKQSQQVTPPPTPAPPRPTPAPTAPPEQYAKADSQSEGSNKIVAPVKAPVKSIGKKKGRGKKQKKQRPPHKTEDVQQQPVHKAVQEYRDDECPSSAEYIAFSLNAARKRMEGFKAEDDFRVTAPGVFNIGCINKIHGLVYDREARDIIIVGKHEPKRAVVTLDDLVVVLRARFVHSKWPLVSIDPTPDTEKTNMQLVRFEGGIEDTQFGEDLFDADFRLKKISFGLLPSSVDEVDSYWNLSSKDTSIQSGNRSINARFWFFGSTPVQRGHIA